MGTAVMVSGHRGIVRFIGTAKFAAGVWCGIELDEKVGKNNGTVGGVSYFECPANHGYVPVPSAPLWPALHSCSAADRVAPSSVFVQANMVQVIDPDAVDPSKSKSA